MTGCPVVMSNAPHPRPYKLINLAEAARMSISGVRIDVGVDACMPGIAGTHAAADLGYTGVDGIAIVPVRTRPAASCMTARWHSTKTSAPSAPPSSGLSRT